MAVYKRYKGKRVTRKDPNYDKGTWIAEGAIDGVRYHKALKTAKTKADADTAEELLIAQIHHGELEFLKLAGTELTYKEIADQLGISFHTVRQHIGKIYEKLHVQNKTEAINKVYGSRV